MRAFLLILITALSLAWIAYSTYNLSLKDKLSFHPEFVFNEKDSAVFIVNRSGEIENVANFVSNGTNPFLNLDLNLFEKGNKFYFSCKRPLLLIEKNANWTEMEIQKLVQSLNIPKKDIYYNNGSFICISGEDINLNEKKNTFLQLNDKNSTANIVEFFPELTNTDIYRTNTGNFRYISERNIKALSGAVNDELYFSYVLPEEIEDYSFYERDYLSSLDSVFDHGVMRTWVDKGIVMGTLNGEEFLVSDYLPQQNPVLILQEKADVLDTNFLINEIKTFTGFKLTESFPKGNRIYVLPLEDKVLMAESESTCNKLALHFKLGKTLALNRTKSADFYSDLTKDVHFREINQNIRRSISFSENQRFEVRTQMTQNTELNVSKNQGVQTIALGKKVKSLELILDHIRGGYSYFVTFDDASFGLYSKTGKLIFNSNVKGDIQDVEIIDIYQNNKYQIAILTANSLHVIDLNGNEVNGFPYIAEHAISTSLSSVSWRGQSKFIFGDDNGSVVMLNAKGMELYSKKLGNDALTGDVFGLNRGGTLTAWVQTNNSSYCVELEKSKVLQKLESMGKLQLKNGVEIISIKSVDGGKSELLNISGEKLSEIGASKIYTDGKHFFSEEDGFIKAYTPYGDLISSINKSNQEISRITSFEKGGKNYTLVLDNLENNIYLFGAKDELMKSWPKEGENILDFIYNKETNTLKVISVLDNNLIIYTSQI